MHISSISRRNIVRDFGQTSRSGAQERRVERGPDVEISSDQQGSSCPPSAIWPWPQDCRLLKKNYQMDTMQRLVSSRQSRPDEVGEDGCCGGARSSATAPNVGYFAGRPKRLENSKADPCRDQKLPAGRYTNQASMWVRKREKPLSLEGKSCGAVGVAGGVVSRVHVKSTVLLGLGTCRASTSKVLTPSVVPLLR